jgi:hypothetical protein
MHGSNDRLLINKQKALSSNPSTLGSYFLGRGLLFAQVSLDHNPIYVSCILGMIDMCQLLVERALSNFLLC